VHTTSNTPAFIHAEKYSKSTKKKKKKKDKKKKKSNKKGPYLRK
tara:strand:+ start:1193 stop:1324 length:132 start_codon:yes stop_codon:yes gene_type:complete